MILSQIINKAIEKVSAKDIYGVKAIGGGVFSYFNFLKEVELPDTCKIIYPAAFYSCTNLKKLVLPPSVEKIYTGSFGDCTSLQDIDLNVSPYCIISGAAFSDCPFGSDATDNVVVANGKILFIAKNSTWPESVINIAGGTGANLVIDSCLTIPDRIEIIGGAITGSPTKMILGSSTRILSTESIPTSVTELICRQPAGMKISLPTAGETFGLTYNKNSRAVNIYTDNEDIRNYNWSGDNVTPTFYSLSQAPA